MKVILSIKPEYVEKIFNGKKRFEYRKANFSKTGINTVIVYSTMPVGKIVGEFTISDVLVDEPSNLWKRTSEHSGIDHAFFKSYFNGRSKGVAFQIENPILYTKPINPKEKYVGFVAPQSFMYKD